MPKIQDELPPRSILKHPADKALHTSISPVHGRTSSLEKAKYLPLLRQDPQQGLVFHRLIHCYKFFDDPLAKVIFPNISNFDKAKRRSGHSREVHIVPHVGIGVPACCSLHRKEVEKEVAVQKKYLYNSPPPSSKRITRPKQRLELLVKSQVDGNQKHNYPLSTVSVRWHGMSGYYTALTLRRVLSRFCKYGGIEEIIMTSPNSANVVFDNMVDACAIVDLKMIGSTNTRLFCFWHHKSMGCKTFYGTGTRFKVFNDELLNPSS